MYSCVCTYYSIHIGQDRKGVVVDMNHDWGRGEHQRKLELHDAGVIRADWHWGFVKLDSPGSSPGSSRLFVTRGCAHRRTETSWITYTCQVFGRAYTRLTVEKALYVRRKYRIWRKLGKGVAFLWNWISTDVVRSMLRCLLLRQRKLSSMKLSELYYIPRLLRNGLRVQRRTTGI